MSEKTDKRRADLRARIIDLAEAGIDVHGIHSLKARALAAEAGCAVGAIYNVFSDMNGVVLAVNARTFRRLGQAVTNALDAAGPCPPHQSLIVMGKAYLAFAAQNKLTWRALFDIEMSVQSEVPDWYVAEMRRLFAIIAGPLSLIHPEKTEDDILLLTRALFSSIHGIVWLGLEQRISGVPVEQIGEMIEAILTNFAGAAPD